MVEMAIKLSKKFPQKPIIKEEDVEIWSKRGYSQRLLWTKTNNWYFTMDLNKLVVSDKVPCNNGKDCHYIVGYQVDETLIPLFIQTPKNIFSYGVLQYNKNTAYTMSFNVWGKSGCLSIKRFGMKLGHSYLQHWQRNW